MKLDNVISEIEERVKESLIKLIRIPHTERVKVGVDLIEQAIGNTFEQSDHISTTSHLITYKDLKRIERRGHRWVIPELEYKFYSRRSIRVFIKRNEGMLNVTNVFKLATPLSYINLSVDIEFT